MYEKLQQQLGHRFSRPDLLKLALTHRSFAHPHNERLEFLGDSIFNGVVSMWLYRQYPEATEGHLTRLRAHLVCQDSLVRMAEKLSLGNYLQLGEGEIKSGGARRPSILADAMEAIFAAVTLDCGMAAAERVIMQLILQFSEIMPGDDLLKDAKTRLQEWSQGRGLSLPTYHTIQDSQNGNLDFVVRCSLQGVSKVSTGSGKSRKQAEQMAAMQLLAALTDMATIK